MRRISATIPEKVADALERAVRLDPTRPPKSRIISDALLRYLGSLYPQLFRRDDLTGPSVLAALKSTRPRGPSPTLRRTKLALAKWKQIES
jgi:hypothetical protein